MNRKSFRKLAVLPLMLLLQGQVVPDMDADNPTCPARPNWSINQTMELTPVARDGIKILLAEGIVDEGLPKRLEQVLAEHPDILEIWIRSPGGLARAGNQAGRIIREQGGLVITRIPSGWTCFSACNFVFMGGRARIVEPNGFFMVHMFTMTGNRDAISYSVEQGTDPTIALIGEIEQESALLASEDNDFLIRMGVSRKLLTDIMYKQKAVTDGSGDRSTRRCLTRDEALKYNVSNVEE